MHGSWVDRASLVFGSGLFLALEEIPRRTWDKMVDTEHEKRMVRWEDMDSVSVRKTKDNS